MMRMQPEAEGYSGQVSCGGAARRLDVSALSELRNRVAGAHDALDDASSAGARTANAPSFATAAAMSAEAVAEDDGLDARRRILRRRVLLALGSLGRDPRDCMLGIPSGDLGMACRPSGGSVVRRRP